MGEIVDDQDLVAGQPALQAEQALLLAGLEQFVHQRGGGDEADRHALLACRHPERDRDMGLAGAEIANRDDVLLARDILAPRQLQHDILVERRDCREVEGVQALHRREPRLLDATLDQPPLPLDQFELGQAQQITRGVETFGGVLLRQPLVLGEECRQLERFEVAREQPVSLTDRRGRRGRNRPGHRHGFGYRRILAHQQRA